MKKCQRCLAQEYPVIYQMPSIRVWNPAFELVHRESSMSYEYVENKVGKDGLCRKCEVHVAKIRYDKNHKLPTLNDK